jgi:hypothetical protein
MAAKKRERQKAIPDAARQPLACQNSGIPPGPVPEAVSISAGAPDFHPERHFATLFARFGGQFGGQIFDLVAAAAWSRRVSRRC